MAAPAVGSFRIGASVDFAASDCSVTQLGIRLSLYEILSAIGADKIGEVCEAFYADRNTRVSLSSDAQDRQGTSI